MSDYSYIVRNENGVIVSLSIYRPIAAKGHTVERHEHVTACELARAEWFPNGDPTEPCDHCKGTPPRGHTCPRCKAATP